MASPREAAAARSRARYGKAAECGPLPKVVDPARRELCREDFVAFVLTYFSLLTDGQALSEDHERVARRMQNCCLHGGRFVNSVFRGFGKTTWVEYNALWAVLYGHRKFVAILGADKAAAARIMASIKMELQENDLLYDDFPELHCIRALGGKPQGAASQTLDGALTHVGWLAEKVVLPTIVGVASSGAIISAHGLTAASRGLRHKTPDGRGPRPDYAILDDPQTDKSARSRLQVTTRLDLLNNNILGFGGHKKRLACVVNGTVICPDDMIERLLDRKLSPGWQGERIPLLKSPAIEHDTLWLTEYATLRTTFDALDPNGQVEAQRQATAFYAERRSAMDAGAVVAWAGCFDPDSELSAIQHAYNLMIDQGQKAFETEYQLQPPKPASTAIFDPTRSAFESRVTGLARGTIPLACDRLTAFVDVHHRVLVWMVCAWDRHFGGCIIDYGAYPDQKAPYWTTSDARRTMQLVHQGSGLEAAVHAGLRAIMDELSCRDFVRQDGTAIRITAGLIDYGYGPLTDTVFSALSASSHAATWKPSKGRGITAANKPMIRGEYEQRPGDRLGHHWLQTRGLKARQSLQVQFDANYWKSFVMRRLAAAIGDHSALTVFGQAAHEHQLLIDHLAAETAVETTGRGRTVQQWTQKPSKPDNHFFDCLAGCAVAASVSGLLLEAAATPAPARRRYTSIDQLPSTRWS